MLSSNIFKKNQNSQDIFLHINLVLKNLSKIYEISYFVEIRSVDDFELHLSK